MICKTETLLAFFYDIELLILSSKINALEIQQIKQMKIDELATFRLDVLCLYGNLIFITYKVLIEYCNPCLIFLHCYVPYTAFTATEAYS